MWFPNFRFLTNPTSNFLFSMGWCVINLYTTFYLLYKKSILYAAADKVYNIFVSTTSVEYIPNAEDCDFVIFTFDKIHKRIAKPYQPLMDAPHKALQQPPFLSTEILVTSSDGKAVTNHPVEFRTDHYDYYVEGNVFHDLFLTYFMKKHYKINLKGCDYSIHAVDRLTFDTLVFLKNGNLITIGKQN
jgi:hypothetical protein